MASVMCQPNIVFKPNICFSPVEYTAFKITFITHRPTPSH